MELAAICDTLFVRDGRKLRIEPPGVGVELPSGRPARGRDRDMLFVHLGLASTEDPPAVLYRETLQALARSYFMTSGSVTAALRQAIRAANEYLMRHNLRVEGVAKLQGGITCGVLRDEEVFIAQVGPALGFVAHQGKFERIPPRRPGHMIPLGIGYGVDTRFYHSWVHPGDVLLLAGPESEDLGDPEVAEAVVYQGVSSGIARLQALVKSAGHDQARLLMVEFVPSADPSLPQPPETAVQVPAREVEAQTVAEPPAAVEPTEPEAPLPPPETQPTQRRPSLDVDLEGGARKIASGIARALARVTQGIVRVLEALFGVPPPDGQATRRGDGLSPAAMGLIAILIPVVVTVIAIAVYLQRGRAEQFQDLLLHMQQESELAMLAVADAPLARQHWQAVLNLSEEALRLRPTHETIMEFRSQANNALDVLDEVTRLAIHDLYSYRRDSLPTALTVHGLAVYVLDPVRDTAYKHLLETDLELAEGHEPEVIAYAGLAVGGVTVGELVDLVWFPKSGQLREDTVALVDDNGLLLRYRPAWGDLVSTQLEKPAGWNMPKAVAVYADNLYVLDTGANQVWRFSPTDGAFQDEPEPYPFEDNQDGNPTNNVELDQMVDMVIDREGHLYLLGQDGSVHKFFGGQRKTFALNGLEQPLTGPTSIFCSVSGLNPFFYLVDPGTGRVVQTTHQGQFIAQFRARGADLADPFASLGGIHVEEVPILRMYATTGDTLIAAAR